MEAPGACKGVGASEALLQAQGPHAGALAHHWLGPDRPGEREREKGGGRETEREVGCLSTLWLCFRDLYSQARPSTLTLTLRPREHPDSRICAAYVASLPYVARWLPCACGWRAAPGAGNLDMAVCRNTFLAPPAVEAASACSPDGLMTQLVLRYVA